MYECHKCHKEFTTDEHLKYHLAFNPSHKDDLMDRDEYNCPECGDINYSKSELEDHIRDDHEDDDDSITDLLAVGAGLAIESAFGSDDNNNGDDFGGFGGGDFDGGGADNSW